MWNFHTFPIILQRVEDAGTRNIRLQGNVQKDRLPHPTGSYDSLRRRTVGYDLVVNLDNPADMSPDTVAKQLSEAQRVARPEGKVVFGFVGEGDAEQIQYAARDLNLHLVQEVFERDTDSKNHHILTVQHLIY